MRTHAVGELAVDVGRLVWVGFIHIADGNTEPGGVYPEVLEIENNVNSNDSSEKYSHPQGMQIPSSPSPWVERLSVTDINVTVVINIVVHIDCIWIQVLN